ncbi:MULTISPECIES: ABC transporter substrate-binding protein [unclassified Rhodococcus (in: high G+C Gram-positive bacteria)]|uniref:ABC transporter substrate-binding protein n=1 Tax=unclassified Rhodococcus (in: high G+C Gram-positive bacteria) TaxID=192944 RepID=UPI001594ED0E|nr:MULTISPECIES: extracellular solute-binding protein [unclassified Rhodococcus (in: high G+C Gram-positive bacteria)]
MSNQSGGTSRNATAPVRRRGLRFVGAVGATALAVGLASGCGASEDYTDYAVELPDYYPADYSDIVTASKAEGGSLTIYSNTDQQSWAPIFKAFQAKFPWVGSINATNLDSDEVFQRVLSEQATGQASADVVVSNAADAWADFAEREGTVAQYTSPELSQLPEFAEALPSVYSMSVDPISLIYNTELLDESQFPTSIEDLATKVQADPDSFDGMIAVRNPKGAFGFTVTRAFVENDDAAWDELADILPYSKNETSTGSMVEKVTAGEYSVGFFMGAPALTAEQRTGGLIKAVFPSDGTPLLRRGISIADGAPHEATAKLFTDFVMSEDGQTAVAEGGLTAYRDGVEKPEDGVATYSDVVDSVGEENTVLVPYIKATDEEIEQFSDRWTSLQTG